MTKGRQSATTDHNKYNLTIPLQQLNGLEALVIIMVANKYAFLEITRRRFLNEWEAFKKVISRRNIRRRIAIILHLSETRVLRCVFFFQAEDGIRDLIVTGVQTCALPIYNCSQTLSLSLEDIAPRNPVRGTRPRGQEGVQAKAYSKNDPSTPQAWLPNRTEPFSKIGRASCRERV